MNKDAKQMIEELCDKYGDSAEQIIAQGLNLEKKGTGYKCPNVHSHKNGDNNPSMGWVKGKNYFNCLGCGETINIYSYFKNYLNYTFSEIMHEEGIEGLLEKRKAFQSNVKKETEKLTDEQIEYLANRVLYGETIKFFKLANTGGAIGIPYFKNGQLIAVKKRFTSGKMKNSNVTGSKPFLFNCDNTELDKPVVITEGEIDAMTVWQSGYKNVMSVGCGANAVKTLFEQSSDFLNKFESIILFTDNDEYGNNMDKAFLEEFQGKVATVDKSLYIGLKDANDIFSKHGAKQILKIIESGKVTFDGEWDIDSNPYEGLDPKDTKFIRTGIDTIDYAINTIQSRTVTLITGRSNAGKTTFVTQIMSNAVEQKFKVYLVAGEGEKNKIVNKFYTSLIGYDKQYYDEKMFGLRMVKEPKPQVLKAIQEWHRGKLKLYVKSLSKYKTEDELFKMLEYQIRIEKYDLVVLDNLMSLLTVSRNQDKNEAQGQFIEKCHHLAKSTNCAVVVVLHPNKTYQKGQELEFEQISGTSDIPNKADAILSVIRLSEPEDGATSKIQVNKNRDWSELPVVKCVFDPNTCTYAEIKDGVAVVRQNNGWKKNLTKSMEIDKKYLESVGK